MALIYQYDSSQANTSITVTTTANTSIRTYIRSLSTTTQYGCQTYTLSGQTLYGIPASAFSSSNRFVLLKMVAPTANIPATQKFMGVFFAQIGSNLNYTYSIAPRQCWRKEGYIYAILDYYTLLSTSQPIYPVYYKNSSSSGSYNYTNYYPIEVVSATQLPNWNRIPIRVYDDGTSHQIQPFIWFTDQLSNSDFNYNYSNYYTDNTRSSRVWEVTPGNTYTVKAKVNTVGSNIVAFYGDLSSPLVHNRQTPSYTETQPTMPTPTTDPDTGEYVYTFTIPEGKTSLRICYIDSNRNKNFFTAVNPKLYGQRTAGWYEIDSYYLDSNNWLNDEDVKKLYR